MEQYRAKIFEKLDKNFEKLDNNIEILDEKKFEKLDNFAEKNAEGRIIRTKKGLYETLLVAKRYQTSWPGPLRPLAPTFDRHRCDCTMGLG